MIKKMTLRLNEDVVEKLEKLIETKYKGRGSLSDAMRWLIEDVWDAECKPKEVEEVG
jgi:hypothetical protein